MKRITMELGGHAPAVICSDADIEEAVSILVAAKFRNAGQVCVAPTRILADDQVFDNVLEGFCSGADHLKVGNGLEPGVTMGPLVNSRRREAIETLVEDAVERGANVHYGAPIPNLPGWFCRPTVLWNVPTDAKIMNEEPFGPVAIINRTGSLDEAISEANRLPFGLASFAFTKSQENVYRLSNQMEAGMLTINHNRMGLPEVPFGGIKDSGIGTEGGIEAIEPYLLTKFVTNRIR